MSGAAGPDVTSVTVVQPDRVTTIAGAGNVVWFSPRGTADAEVGLVVFEDGRLELLLASNAYLSGRGIEKYQDLLRSLSEIVSYDQFRARVEGGES